MLYSEILILLVIVKLISFQFAHLLDESSEGAAMSYLGKKPATQKQLQWEEKRNPSKRQTFKKRNSFKPKHKQTNKKNKKRK